MKNKKIKFISFCEINININSDEILDFLQNTLNNALLAYKNEFPMNKQIYNLEITSVEEDKDTFISGETCTICGFNGKTKVVDLNDEFITLYCPQCHSKFKIKIVE